MRAIVAVLMLAVATSADACTTFCTRGLFGRNYDFEIGDGLVMVNKRGVRKIAQTGAPRPGRRATAASRSTSSAATTRPAA